MVVFLDGSVSCKGRACLGPAFFVFLTPRRASLPSTAAPNIAVHYHSSLMPAPSDMLPRLPSSSPIACACPPAPRAVNDNFPNRLPVPIPSSSPIHVPAPPPSPHPPRDSVKPPGKAAPEPTHHRAA